MKGIQILCLLFFSGLLSFTSGSSEFHFVNVAKIYAEAKSYCRDTYTDLATVHNSADMDNLIASVPREKAWIGLEIGDVWRWHWSSPDKTLDFLNWEAGEPQNDNQDMCAAMDTTVGKWFVSDCDTQHSFVCDGSNGPQHHVFIAEGKSWREAQNHCRDNSSELVSIQSAEDTVAVQEVSQAQTVWIGLFKDRWKWSDGSSSSFRFWKPKQPNYLNGNQECVAAIFQNTGQWNDLRCNTKRKFVCHGAPTKETSTQQAITTVQMVTTQTIIPNSSSLAVMTSTFQMTTALPTEQSSTVKVTTKRVTTGILPDLTPTAATTTPTTAATTPPPPTAATTPTTTPPPTTTPTAATTTTTAAAATTTTAATTTPPPTPTAATTPPPTPTAATTPPPTTTTAATRTTTPPPTTTTTAAATTPTPPPTIAATTTTTIPTTTNAATTPTATLTLTLTTTSTAATPTPPTTAATTPTLTTAAAATTTTTITTTTPTTRAATTPTTSATTTPEGTSTYSTAESSTLMPSVHIQENMILIQENMTWNEAMSYCRENHVDLVYITAKEIDGWAAEKAKNATSSHVWLGLRYSCSFDFWFWIKSYTHGCYQNWAPGQGPEGQYGCGITGAIETTGGQQWVGLPETEKLNFICYACTETDEEA